MPMTQDQERWAEALAIERLHGGQAMAWILERIEALRAKGDGSGVERLHGGQAMAWILERIEALRAKGDGSGVERFTILAARLDQLQVGRHSTIG